MKRLDLATLSVRFLRIWSVGPESAGPVQRATLCSSGGN